MNIEARPLKEGLYTWPSDDPQLIASQCAACDEITFPSQESCPNCTGRDVNEVLLSRQGRLYTWTVQRFPPPAPPYIGPSARDSFQPFGVGYVELSEGVRVEARLTESDASQLEIGMEMELVIQDFVTDDDGVVRNTFAFRPLPQGARS